MPKGFFYDGGLGGKGGLVQQRGCIIMICPSCQERRPVRRVALTRAGRVECACGVKMEPSKAAQKRLGVLPKQPLAKRGACERCGCNLRQSNTGKQCGPCQLAIAIADREPPGVKYNLGGRAR